MGNIEGMGHFDPEEEFLKEMFAENQTHVPEALKGHIMTQVEVRRELFEYRPVIGKRTWYILGSLFGLCMLWLMLQVSNPGVVGLISLPDLSYIVWPELSDRMMIWLGGMALPELPVSLLGAIAILVVFGLYFMLGFGKAFFHTPLGGKHL